MYLLVYVVNKAASMVKKLKQNSNAEPTSYPLHVTLPIPAYEALKQCADDESQDVSRVVRDLIADYLAARGYDRAIVKVQRGGYRGGKQTDKK